MAAAAAAMTVRCGSVEAQVQRVWRLTAPRVEFDEREVGQLLGWQHSALPTRPRSTARR
jgi:hypothetical protein